MPVWQSSSAQASRRARTNGGKVAARGVHFAIDESTLATLVACKADGDKLEYVSEVIEQAWHENMACETDKAWPLIHSGLQGTSPCEGELVRSKDDPTSWAILGRTDLLVNKNGMIGLVKSDDVKEVSRILKSVDVEKFAARLSWLIDRCDCDNLNADDVAYATGWLPGLVDFYGLAAASNRNVIFTVDF